MSKYIMGGFCLFFGWFLINLEKKYVECFKNLEESIGLEINLIFDFVFLSIWNVVFFLLVFRF